MLQLGVAQLEAGRNGSARQSGIYGVNLLRHFLVEDDSKVFLNNHIYLATLQCCQHIGNGRQAYDVSIGGILGGCHVLDAADDNCYTLTLQPLENGRNRITAGFCRLCNAGKDFAALLGEEPYMRGTRFVREEHLLLAFFGDIQTSNGDICFPSLNRRYDRNVVH